MQPLTERVFPNIHPVQIVPSSAGNRRKADIVRAAYAGAKEYHGEISQAEATLLDVG